jgi:hypothetical protein
MLSFVEIWHRQTADAAYRRHGIEELEGLLAAGTAMTLEVDGGLRRVTVDKVAPHRGQHRRHRNAVSYGRLKKPRAGLSASGQPADGTIDGQFR